MQRVEAQSMKYLRKRLSGGSGAGGERHQVIRQHRLISLQKCENTFLSPCTIHSQSYFVCLGLLVLNYSINIDWVNK